MKEWKEYTVDYDSQPGKNFTLYITHKPGMSVRLLTCAPLTSNLPNKMKNKSHLLDLSDDIDKSSLPDKLILVCPIFLICSLTWTIKEERKQSTVIIIVWFIIIFEKSINRMHNGGTRNFFLKSN